MNARRLISFFRDPPEEIRLSKGVKTEGGTNEAMPEPRYFVDLLEYLRDRNQRPEEAASDEDSVDGPGMILSG